MKIWKAIPIRLTAAFALGALVFAALAPAAQAGPAGKRSKPSRRGGYETRVVHHVHRPARVILREGTCDAPALAGFLGGLILGVAVSHAATPEPVYAPPPPRYDYYDPYCDACFRSLSASGAHYRACHHPRVIRVIETSSGDCVDTYLWAPGGWRTYHPEDESDWGDEGRGDGRD